MDSSDSFFEQLAGDIARDGFSRHAKQASAFAQLLQEEANTTALLAEIVIDTSLSEVVRQRAFGRLHAAIKNEERDTVAACGELVVRC